MSIGKAPGLGLVKLAREKMDLSRNIICWPPSERLTFSFMFYMTHFKLQCSTDIERSLPLPTLPQTPHNGKSKNFQHKHVFFVFCFFFLKTKSQSLMGLFSCQNSHWCTVAIFTKGHDERGRPILRPLPLCYLKHTCVSVLGIRRIVIFEPFIGM